MKDLSRSQPNRQSHTL